MSMMACAHKTQKRDVEVWLIDEVELVLYRKIAGGKEQVIPIKSNRSMHQFMCVSEDALYDLVEDTLERGEK